MKSILLKNSMLIFAAVGALLTVAGFLIWRMKKNLSADDNLTAAGSGYMMAMAMQNVLQGKASPQDLAQLIYDALRLSQYKAIMATMPTLQEMQQHFDATLLQQYPLLQATMQQRQVFLEKIRELFKQNTGTLKEVIWLHEKDHPVGEQSLYLLTEVALVLQQAQQEVKLPIGSFVLLPLGWKYLPCSH